MNRPTPIARATEADVDPMFVSRWSPRAFAAEPIPANDLATLFEAARWAPSCFNEQPWLFLYAQRAEDLERFRGLLVPGNRAWADAAPVLVIAFARRTFARNAKPNRWAGFDTGAAWMSLALQAQRLGYVTHAMGGFDEARAYQELGVPAEEWEAIAAIAIGRAGNPAQLPAEIAAREMPSGRKPLADVAREGQLPS